MGPVKGQGTEIEKTRQPTTELLDDLGRSDRDSQITAGANPARVMSVGVIRRPIFKIIVTASLHQSQKVVAKNKPPQLSGAIQEVECLIS
ncbi:hypothetical protein I41_25140 [Lacipirellula limnantheis]|uniref:Uncharacterized protein n=1 Tax=Lacipirellula limnantheis TaxID=2528024 RepID=A0A517TY96_9BACT|nr:hypothetical protein I41_25140 [Lacipirellula limnantheis]